MATQGHSCCASGTCLYAYLYVIQPIRSLYTNKWSPAWKERRKEFLNRNFQVKTLSRAIEQKRKVTSFIKAEIMEIMGFFSSLICKTKVPNSLLTFLIYQTFNRTACQLCYKVGAGSKSC